MWQPGQLHQPSNRSRLGGCRLRRHSCPVLLRSNLRGHALLSIAWRHYDVYEYHTDLFVPAGQDPASLAQALRADPGHDGLLREHEDHIHDRGRTHDVLISCTRIVLPEPGQLLPTLRLGRQQWADLGVGQDTRFASGAAHPGGGAGNADKNGEGEPDASTGELDGELDGESWFSCLTELIESAQEQGAYRDLGVQDLAMYVHAWEWAVIVFSDPAGVGLATRQFTREEMLANIPPGDGFAQAQAALDQARAMLAAALRKRDDAFGPSCTALA